VILIARLCAAAALGFGLAGLSYAADGPTIARQQCAHCHGDNAASTDSSIPTIGGFSTKYIVESMKAFRKKVRPCKEVTIPSGPKKGTRSDMCKEITNLTDADFEAVAKHYSAQKFFRVSQPFDAAKAKQGQTVYKLRCEKCHENNGSSPHEDNGILAGQWTPYLREQLVSFRAGKRPIDEKMKLRLDRVNKEEEEAVLHFFASQQP
jgi:cytochrome subunit of sulfide dehydrogenase